MHSKGLFLLHFKLVAYLSDYISIVSRVAIPMPALLRARVSVSYNVRPRGFTSGQLLQVSGRHLASV